LSAGCVLARRAWNLAWNPARAIFFLEEVAIGDKAFSLAGVNPISVPVVDDDGAEAITAALF
jgi:hypothetical protein